MNEILDDFSHEGVKIEELVFASFGQRLAARIIDALIMIIPQAFIPILPFWLYRGFMESGNKQASLGQQAVGIMVVDMQGRPISFGRATGRFFGSFLSTLILFIGFLMMLGNDKKQCLHDMMAGTLVVQSK